MSEFVDETGKKVSIRKQPDKWKEEAEKRGFKKKGTKVYRIEVGERDWKLQDISLISVGSEDGQIVLYIEGTKEPTQAQLNLIIERLNNKYKIKNIKEVV